MSLPKPELDDLTFEQLISEARGLIPRYAPEWTDHNISDPGITLAELLAWLTETSLYRLNLVTERHVRKYLQLLGITLQPIKPASVELSFESESDVELKKGQLLWTELEGERICFELDHPVKITTSRLVRVVTDEVAGVFDRTDSNNEPELFFAPFGEATMDGASLYLGFESPSDVVNLFIELYEDDLIPPGRHGNEPYYDFENATLVWEIYKEKDQQEEGHWCEIESESIYDETGGFKYSGRITLENIEKWKEKTLPFFDDDGYNLYWLRCRLKKSRFEYPPRIRTIRLNTVRATQGRTIKDAETFNGTGLPEQIYKLSHSPVLKGTVELYIEDEKWMERPDLYGSGPQDRHFCIDHKEGKIIFGDGLMGAVPPDGADIVVKHYRTGGGTTGNLPAGLQWSVEGYPSVRATNYSPANGGRDEESVEEARLGFLKDLRTPYRAVTSEDFEYIAKNTPGLRIARTKAYVKEKTVYLVVVPYTPLEEFKRPPEPSDGMLNAICRHIDSHRLVGTCFEVIKPDYIKVYVSMKIKAKTGTDEDILRERIIRRLNTYLHPVRGGSDGGGWPPGEPVYRSEIYRVVEGIEGVRCVMDVRIRGEKGAYTDQSGNLILPGENSVVYPGSHSILFLKDQERCRKDG